MTWEENNAKHGRREKLAKKSRADFDAIIQLAGFTVSRVWELANGYWPLAPDYDDVREPWWLYMTEIGPVQVGWRKRVIAITWDATPVRAEVTADEVTKSDDGVHAYSVEKAVEYLRALRVAAQAPSPGEEPKR